MIYKMRNDHSIDILRVMCRDMFPTENKTMVEIGSYIGESAVIFAQYFKTVFAIDPWLVGMYISDGSATENNKCYMDENVEGVFDEVAGKYSNIVKIKEFDNNALHFFQDNSVDFLYIDAIHTEDELTRQIKDWLPKVNIRGVIGGHDYNRYFDGVIRAVNNTIGAPDKVYSDDGISWTKYKSIWF